jgi:hypothetical protein
MTNIDLFLNIFNLPPRESEQFNQPWVKYVIRNILNLLSLAVITNFTIWVGLIMLSPIINGGKIITLDKWSVTQKFIAFAITYLPTFVFLFRSAATTQWRRYEQ